MNFNKNGKGMARIIFPHKILRREKDKAMCLVLMKTEQMNMRLFGALGLRPTFPLLAKSVKGSSHSI